MNKSDKSTRFYVKPIYGDSRWLVIDSSLWTSFSEIDKATVAECATRAEAEEHANRLNSGERK